MLRRVGDMRAAPYWNPCELLQKLDVILKVLLKGMVGHLDEF